MVRERSCRWPLVFYHLETHKTVTHPSRLALSRQQLKFFVVAELDENIDRPLSIVFVVGGDLNLSGTTNS